MTCGDADRQPAQHPHAVIPALRVVVASTGGSESVSTQYRLGPLARLGPWPVEARSARPIPLPEQIDEIEVLGGPGAVLVLQRVLATPADVARLRRRFEAIIFDFDDAIYAVPPQLGAPRVSRMAKQAVRTIVRGGPRVSSRRGRLVQTLGAVDLAVAGNAVLARFAERHASRVEVIPTTIEPVTAPPESRPDPPVAVWMGLPDNLQYLNLIRRPLARVVREIPFRLRIVSSRGWERAPVPAEFVQWTAEASREALLGATVGLAPLTDDPWTRGKCVFRSIQYGGHALPAVASPIGVTDRVVLHGHTGFLAGSEAEWAEWLLRVLGDPELASRTGRRAHEWIGERYSDRVAHALWRSAIAAAVE